SGKTRVLTERLRHLLDDRGWEPGVVSALAYNTRAADELRERTQDLGAHIRTLNSLGLAITNGTGGFLAPAGRPRRQVIEEPQVRAVLDRLIQLPRLPNTDPHVPYLEGLRAVRLALRDPGQVESELEAPGLAELFSRYRRLLADERLVDFDGQLYEALEVLLTDHDARVAAQGLARHLLVDELQDLTPAHMLVLRLLAAPGYDVFGVGDDDQVIYGFAGATPELLLGFDRYFPGASHYTLEVNYRCPPAVVQAAGHVLSYNDRRIAKLTRAAPGRSGTEGELVVRRVDELGEAAEAAAAIQAWREEGAALQDVAVLARVNAALLPLQVLCVERGIPSRRPLDAAILARTGIRCALAYLRIGGDPGRIQAGDLTETIRRPSRRISRRVVDMLTRRGATSLVDIRRLTGRLTGSDAPRLLEYAADLDLVVAAVGTGEVRAALSAVRVEVGLGQAMDVLDGVRREAERSTHADDLTALEQVAALHPDPASFEPWLRGVLDRRDAAEAGVELSTIHRRTRRLA
ncbi:MAG: UvrD-helicase domain-containing protein, partial [Acidimicrobiales bacterium]